MLVYVLLAVSFASDCVKECMYDASNHAEVDEDSALLLCMETCINLSSVNFVESKSPFRGRSVDGDVDGVLARLLENEKSSRLMFWTCFGKGRISGTGAMSCCSKRCVPKPGICECE